MFVGCKLKSIEDYGVIKKGIIFHCVREEGEYYYIYSSQYSYDLKIHKSMIKYFKLIEW